MVDCNRKKNFNEISYADVFNDNQVNVTRDLKFNSPMQM